MELSALANGVGLAVELREGPLVVMATRVGCGSGDDPAARPGMAHLVEHLAFGWVGVDFDAQIQAVGGDSNGWTEPDATVLSTVVPAEAQATLFSVEAERLARGPDPDAAGLAAALRVLGAEARVAGTPPLGRVRRALFGPGDPWHRPAVGDPEALAGLEPEELRRWQQACWRPERVDVAVVGPVDRGLLEAWSRRVGAWTAAEAPPGRPAPVAAHVEEGALEAWTTVPWSHPDRPALELLAEAVGGHALSGPDRGLFWVEGARWLGLGRRLEPARARLEARLEAALADPEGRALVATRCLATGVPDCAEADLRAWQGLDAAGLRRVREAWLPR